MHAVIMAGGKGTRLSSLTKGEIPKPMVPVLGEPLLLRQTEQLKQYGVTQVTMIVGYLSEKIREYFGDGKKFGLDIDYIEEKEPLGTAGAFYYLRDRISEPYFLLVFGDIFFDADLSRMERFHQEHHAEATLFTHPNAHPFDSDLIRTDKEGRVICFDSKNNVRDYWYDNLVNAGIYILDKKVLERVKEPVKTDLEKDVLMPMTAERKPVYAYCSPEFVRDIGTVERLRKTEEDIRSGFISARNLKNRQKAIFLDRDGVINVYKGSLTKEEELELIPGSAEAISLINSSEYLAIVATNQPQIAKGLVTFEGLQNIMNKMKTLLGREGAYVNDIYFCPHHPEKGFPGEVPELKIKCDCRKPAPGMLKKAAEKYNIDLSASWMVGDMTLDIGCGKNAGCRTVLVRTGEGGQDGKVENAVPDIVCDDLLAAVKTILGTEK
jgi:mannose-1-phosphate guanylyltransferase/phosphomannomutase